MPASPPAATCTGSQPPMDSWTVTHRRAPSLHLLSSSLSSDVPHLLLGRVPGGSEPGRGGHDKVSGERALSGPFLCAAARAERHAQRPRPEGDWNAPLPSFFFLFSEKLPFSSLVIVRIDGVVQSNERWAGARGRIAEVEDGRSGSRVVPLDAIMRRSSC